MSLVDKLPSAWIGVELPGIRPHPKQPATYSGFQGSMPPVTIDLDGEFKWLAKQQVFQHDTILSEDQHLAEKFAVVQASCPGKLPRSFLYFFNNLELGERIRSCTACYLELPDYVVRTTGVEDGILIHFLSDQQGCAHWNLYIDSKGEHCVLATGECYGYVASERMSRNSVDLSSEDWLWVCAPTFSEFMYRFWIENEIWFATNKFFNKGRNPVKLSPIQLAYVDFYRKA
jgi:hypothetical protein